MAGSIDTSGAVVVVHGAGSLDVDGRAEPKLTLSRGAEGDGGLSRAVRQSDAAIFAAADSSFSTVYYPFVMRVGGLIDNPLDVYYMWYSTDHGQYSGESGIALATAPARTGPWTNQGIVYVDITDGNNTETPSVIYNPDDPSTPFWLYYQQNNLGYNQSTALAKSADGQAFTRFGKVLDYPHYTALPYTEMPGGGHTGYFKPFMVGSLFVGYHVFGGNLSHYAISYSLDGETFQTDPRLTYLNADLTEANGTQFTLLDAVNVNGQWWGFGIKGSGSTYGVACAPLAANLRNFIGRPRDLVFSTEAWEGTYVRSHTLLVDEGRLFVYYTTDNDNVGVAEVV